MAWKETDKRLIRRGELILDPSLLENHEQELKTMNKGRRGRPYLLANTYVELLSAVRYLYGMPYRQLEGFTRNLHTLVPALPSGDYSGLRMPQGDRRTRRDNRRLHRHQRTRGWRLDREGAREEEEVREAPLRRQHQVP